MTNAEKDYLKKIILYWRSQNIFDDTIINSSALSRKGYKKATIKKYLKALKK